MDLEPEHLSWTLDRDLTAISPVAQAVEAHAASLLGQEGATAVELALVEALTNSIKHGSMDGRITEPLFVKAHSDALSLIVEVFDVVPVIPDGLLEEAGAHRLEVDISDIPALAENGRGLSLIVVCVDKVTLRTADDKYVLKLVKYIES